MASLEIACIVKGTSFDRPLTLQEVSAIPKRLILLACKLTHAVLAAIAYTGYLNSGTERSTDWQTGFPKSALKSDPRSVATIGSAGAEFAFPERERFGKEFTPFLVLHRRRCWLQS